MRAGPLSSPKIIKLLNTHFVNVWVLFRELPELQAGAKGTAAAALATKLRQHYTDSVDILTLTADLEVIGHLHNMSLFHPYYLPRGERIPRYLELLKSSAGVEVPAQEPSENPNEAQHQKNIGICSQNLVAIGKAVQAYHNENDDFPEQLSKLYPKYFPDANLLLCPADELGGKPTFSRNADSKMPISYGYEFHPKDRERTQENRTVYGDVLPLVRCEHHANQEFECLNLSFASEVYRSSREWKYTPEDMYETTEKTIAALEAGLQQHPDNESFFYIYRILIRLYIEGGREKDVDQLIDRFKVVNSKTLLAEIHEELGNAELAMEYRRKVTPPLALLGKPVPDFSAIDLDGKPISLQQYRGKVVLLDFWAVWNGFCIGDILNLKKIYDTYRDHGFDIIGVNLDTDETKLRNYLKENDIPWRQIFSGQERQCPLAQQSDVRSIPTRWLIDKDGKLIAHEARHKLISREGREPDLERLVAAAVADKSKHQ